jgi:hypothetical protein
MKVWKKFTSESTPFSYLTLHIKDDEVHKLMRQYRAARFDRLFPLILVGTILAVVQKLVNSFIQKPYNYF